MTLRQRQLLFGVATLIIISFIIILITFSNRLNEPKINTKSDSPVGVTQYDPNNPNISVNGPDALKDSKENPGKEPPEQNLSGPSTNVPERPLSTRYTVEQFDAASTAAIDGLIQYRTVYSSETVAQYQSRISQYFVPDSPTLKDVQAVENGDQSPVTFDSTAVINYSFGLGDLPDNGISFVVAIVSSNQVKDNTVKSPPAIYQTDDTYTVNTVLGDDGKWRIKDIDEKDKG